MLHLACRDQQQTLARQHHGAAHRLSCLLASSVADQRKARIEIFEGQRDLERSQLVTKLVDKLLPES